MPLLCHWSRLFVSLQVGIPSESECLCPTLCIYCDRLVVPPLPGSLRRVDHLISGVLMAIVVGRVHGWPIQPHFLRDLSNVHNQTLWWRCHWWINPLISMWLWCPLLSGLPFQYGLMTSVYPPVGWSIGMASLCHLCSRIYPRVDRCVVILPLH